MIIVRVDDVHPRMNEQNFLRFLELSDRFRCKLLLAVIPDCLDPRLMARKNIIKDFWSMMRDAQKNGHKIAMHGHDHVYTQNDGGLLRFPNKSEFSGLPIEKQMQKISAGISIFEREGVHTDLFVAPSHSFDINTLISLKKKGFKFLSDGFGFVPYYLGGIKLVPQQSGRLRYLGLGVETVCVHLNNWSDDDFQKAEAFFHKYHDKVSPFDYVIRESHKMTPIWYILREIHFVVRILKKWLI